MSVTAAGHNFPAFPLEILESSVISGQWSVIGRVRLLA